MLSERQHLCRPAVLSTQVREQNHLSSSKRFPSQRTKCASSTPSSPTSPRTAPLTRKCCLSRLSPTKVTKASWASSRRMLRCAQSSESSTESTPTLRWLEGVFNRLKRPRKPTLVSGHHREHQSRKIDEIPMKSRGGGIPYGLQIKKPASSKERVFSCLT